MTIWHVPIEPLEARYSQQWIDWFKQHMSIPGVWVQPNRRLRDDIQTGQFLDAHDTCSWKAQQIEMLVVNLNNGNIQDNDVLFFHDLWFPGIEALAYIRHASGVNFKIAGCLHAGLWDFFDFLNQKGMGQWGLSFERSMLSLTDMIFVATEFHRRLIVNCHNWQVTRLDSKIHTTGFPIYADHMPTPEPLENRQHNLVVFPHRLAKEKGYEEFKILAREPALKECEFVCTAEVCKTKAEYYNILAKAGVAVSIARQETWGIAMQEALFSGCFPIMPNRLAYPELYPADMLYNSQAECIEKILWAVRDPSQALSRADVVSRTLQHKGSTAIKRISEHLERLIS